MHRTCIQSVFFVAVFTAFGIAAASTNTLREPLPVEAWVTTDIADAELSPEGTYLAVLREDPEREGHKVVWVYTFNEDGSLKLHRRVNSQNMRIGAFSWLSDQHLLMGLTQQVRNNIDGFNQGVYEGKTQGVDVVEGGFFGIPLSNPGIEHPLPNEPFKLIVSESQERVSGRRTVRNASFYPSFFEYDLQTNRKKLIAQARATLQNIRFDTDGNPELAAGFDLDALETVYKYRPEPKENKWVEFGRSSIHDWELFVPVGNDPTKPNHEYVVAHNGGDKAALWSYDKSTGSFENAELVYGRKDVDVAGTVNHSNSVAHYGEVAGVVTVKENIDISWLPGYELERAIHEQLASIVAEPFSVRVISTSRDGNSLVIRNTGPTSAPTYYLFRDGKFSLIGTSYPMLEGDILAETKFIEYKSRDGMTIPAYLTVPSSGEAPYPLVVMPHGGPYVTEGIGFDPWAQMFANNGYVVLQPQYRGSHNYGLDFYRSAFIDQSQAGYSMQDDKDDGALYLVEQDIVDPDRMAMFGWSYGGYAALVAAMRTPQIYQCTLAGAAVSDPTMQVNYYRYRTDGTQKIEQLNTWDGAFSPFKEVAKVNVPMYVVHGVNDQRVPIDHSRKFVKRLANNDVDYKYTEIEGIDHFLSTMFKSHQTQIYTELLDYLENDCGPEGI